MNGSKIDWLTLSLLRGKSDLDVEKALKMLLNRLELWPLFKNHDFELVGSNHKYEFLFRYRNICIKVPYNDNFKADDNKKAGITVEFSGTGIDYYITRLVELGRDLRSVLKDYLSLSVAGFVPKFNRVDFAVDDKCFGSRGDRPLLDLDEIEDCLKNGRFVSRFRKCDPKTESGEARSVFASPVPVPSQIDKSLPFSTIESMCLSTRDIGKTIYLGRRTSASFVRFYDKLVEQKCKNPDSVDPDLISWVRFEVEFKKDNANAMMMLYIESENDDDFLKKFANVCFGMIRFIDIDRSRRFRCSVADWYVKFIGVISDKGMYINKIDGNKYLRFRKYSNQYLACILAAFLRIDHDGFMDMLRNGMIKTSKSSRILLDDYKVYSDMSPDQKAAAQNELDRKRDGFDILAQFDVDFNKLSDELRELVRTRGNDV